MFLGATTILYDAKQNSLSTSIANGYMFFTLDTVVYRVFFNIYDWLGHLATFINNVWYEKGAK